MAVTRTGSWGYIESTSNSGTADISVPTDAELAVVCVAEYSEGAGDWFSGGTLSLGGDALTASADYDAGSDVWAGVIWTKKTPQTGTKALAWDWAGTGTPFVGLRIYYAFYKGVAAASWIKASGGSNTKSTAQKTTGSLSAETGDMVVGLASSYATGTYTFTWGNVTSQLNANYNDVHYNMAEGTPSGNVTVTSDCAQAYNMMAAIVIAASADAPSESNVLYMIFES